MRGRMDTRNERGVRHRPRRFAKGRSWYPNCVPLAVTGRLLADRYRIVRRLGSGGMATVFLAEDERLSRLVAVKRVHGESSVEVVRRFQREARLGAALNH